MMREFGVKFECKFLDESELNEQENACCDNVLGCKKFEKVHLTTASNLHPYACILEKCPHCLRIVSEQHNPKTCVLCNFEDWEEDEEVENE